MNSRQKAKYYKRKCKELETINRTNVIIPNITYNKTNTINIECSKSIYKDYLNRLDPEQREKFIKEELLHIMRNKLLDYISITRIDSNAYTYIPYGNNTDMDIYTGRISILNNPYNP